ncbi:ATP-dependent nuclease [Lederbergia ruris]|uniref:ATP-dependent nuclease n=1 Tax=Lederbergia ruris TaxID=217495 RepID=UPI0039A20907
MQIKNIHIKGFRNYEDAKINFQPKTLVIGSNDVGKSNLLYALRILLDKGLSEADLEPSDSDFYAFNNYNRIAITIKFINVFEECVVSNFKGKISDNKELFLAFRAYRDPHTGEKKYHFEAGKSVEDLEEIKGRYYLKALNLKYLASTRDLHSFIKKERKNLLIDIKKNRTQLETAFDERYLEKIDKSLDIINKRVGKLNYVKKALVDINDELGNLSFHHQSQNIEFDVGAWDSSQFVDNLNLVSKVKDKNLSISGDGRSNQLFIALWANRNEVSKDNILEVTFYCVEEPEAHLHPQQQRKLAKYLSDNINSQVILTSHSPQIAEEFPPNSIVKLSNKGYKTKAAHDGCSPLISDSFFQFGHRMSIIPAEAFFSSAVLLVEGQSELLFYKALARAIDVDLDRLNISVLMVDGVGFDYYIDVLTTLDIEFVVRTDNDFFKLPKKDTYWFAGLKRCIKIYKTFYQKDEGLEELLEQEDLLTNVPVDIPGNVNKYAAKLAKEFEEFNLFLAEKDLEYDLKSSLVSDQLNKYFGDFDENEDAVIIKEMQKKKATFMFSFINDPETDLSVLKDHSLAKPLLQCIELVEGQNGTD